jgi:hypothetical protein
MKLQTTNKLFALIITIMMFFVLPEFTNSQRKCGPHGKCPKGYICGPAGYCIRSYCQRCPPFLTGTEPKDQATLTSLVYHQSQTTSIVFVIDKQEKISANIYDLSGRLVRTLADEIFQKGEHELIWNTAEVTEGVYYINIGTNDASETNKVVVLK